MDERALQAEESTQPSAHAPQRQLKFTLPAKH